MEDLKKFLKGRGEIQIYLGFDPSLGHYLFVKDSNKNCYIFGQSRIELLEKIEDIRFFFQGKRNILVIND